MWESLETLVPLVAGAIALVRWTKHRFATDGRRVRLRFDLRTTSRRRSLTVAFEVAPRRSEELPAPGEEPRG